MGVTNGVPTRGEADGLVTLAPRFYPYDGDSLGVEPVPSPGLCRSQSGSLIDTANSWVSE
jgi:hypothetical protein